MGQGKDAVHFLVMLLLGMLCCGCPSQHQRQQLVSQATAPSNSASALNARARAQESAGPVKVSEPRPTSPPAAPPPSASTAFLASQTSPAPTPVPPPPPVVPPPGPALDTPPPAPATTPAAADPLVNVKRLLRTATERFAGIDSYIARLRRREQVNGKLNPEETLSFKFRRQPWSIHFKWLSDPGKGREVLYVKGQHGGNIHTLLAAGDFPFSRGGMRIALAPNDPKVLARSRHPITEAGLGALIDRINAVLAAQERGDPRPGTLTYVGFQTRTDYLTADGQPTSLEGIEQPIPPGADPTLPRGGRRLFLFDPANGLPVLVVTRDEKGQEVEYYCYDRLILNVKLDDDDFNPDKIWRKPESGK